MANHSYCCSDCHGFTNLGSTVTMNGKLYFRKGFPRKKTLAKCEHCDSTSMHIVPPDNADLSSVQLGKFSAQSMEAKKAALKRRSKDHFKQHISEKKKFLDKNPHLDGNEQQSA